ncbi:MAG TPA: MASE1 domain-containing protein, partial [Casimicrobiaceae bacterium]|nr:MASE1 domain-containing protein [Casimicrobiaceae bacterium]
PAYSRARATLAAIWVFGGYYVGAKVGFALTFLPNPISVLWPPNSILFAALLLVPANMWWVVIAAALPAHLLAELQVGVPVSMVVSWFVSNASEALIGALSVRLLTRGPLSFGRVRDVTVFIFAASLAAFLSSFLDSALVLLNGWGKSTFWQLWTTRLLSNIATALTLVPMIVIWASGAAASLRSAGWRRSVEAGVLFVGLLVIGALVFGTPIATTDSPALLYVPLPLLLWAGLRFGPAGASISLTIVAFLAIFSAGNGIGALGTGSAAENASAVQMFLIFIAPTMLILAAIVDERRRAEDALRESGERLRLALEAGRMGVWDWDRRTNVVTWSKEQFEIMGLPPVPGQATYKAWLGRVHPDDLASADAAVNAAIATRTEYRHEYRIVRPDGAVRWVESRAEPRFDESGECTRVMGLILDISERKQAEETSQKLSWRLLTAHEDERRRLARELHDDITQRLASLAIDAARFESIEPRTYGEAPRSVHSELVRLSEDVHALSYRLHPSILDDLGLAEALKAECEHVSRREPVEVQVEVQHVPDGLPHDVALCIFRVAQEALRNVARHAGASVATVSLALKEGGLLLAVRDNGIGFDIDSTQSRPSLGRAGMGERVRLLGGTFHIKSTPGQGTTVSAWVPLKVASS